MPDWLEEGAQPLVFEALVPVWNAFQRLHASRSIGGMGGIGPIPIEAVDAYARRFGPHDREGFQAFDHLIGEMDRAYLKWQSAEQERKSARRGRG